MLEPPPPGPRMPKERRPRPVGEGPVPLLARVAASPSERRRALAFLSTDAPAKSAKSEVVVLYDPAETELAGAALIGRLSATTFGLFSCSARWIDERLALRRLVQAVADYARTRDSTYLIVRASTHDVILRGVVAELGYRAVGHALADIEVPPDNRAASWFALCL